MANTDQGNNRFNSAGTGDHRSGQAPELNASPSPEPEPFRAHFFSLDRPSPAWTDRSIYTLTGPTVDGIQHNITIQKAPDVEAASLEAFLEDQVASVEASLNRCTVLLQDTLTLDCELPAGRVIYFWYPAEHLKLYQEQIHVLHEETAYTLTASFTAETRKTLGPEVEQMMRSFTPRLE